MIQLWHCPKCDAAARTVDDKLPHHPCPGMAGLMTPLIRQGTRAHLFATEREDFVGKEQVLLDGFGRPIMSVTTEHEDGSTDVNVFAPTATMRSEE